MMAHAEKRRGAFGDHLRLVLRRSEIVELRLYFSAFYKVCCTGKEERKRAVMQVNARTVQKLQLARYFELIQPPPPVEARYH